MPCRNSADSRAAARTDSQTDHQSGHQTNESDETACRDSAEEVLAREQREGARVLADLELPARMDSLERFSALVEGEAEALELPVRDVMRMRLALEEALTNVIQYAYAETCSTSRPEAPELTSTRPTAPSPDALPGVEKEDAGSSPHAAPDSGGLHPSSGSATAPEHPQEADAPTHAAPPAHGDVRLILARVPPGADEPRPALRFTIIDRGRPFNMLEAPTPDLCADIESRQVGGLGIHFIRAIMDDVRYVRRGGCNILTLVHHQTPPA